jgi:hypothetical protein
MTTISWTAGASGAWSDTSNWPPAAVPGSGDDALIDAAGAYQVTVAGATVNSLTLASALGDRLDLAFVAADLAQHFIGMFAERRP